MSKWEAFKSWCKERWAYLAAALGLLVWGFLLGRREKVPTIKAPTVDTTKIRVAEQQQTAELDKNFVEELSAIEDERYEQIVDQTGKLQEEAPEYLSDQDKLNDYLLDVGKDIRKK